MGELWQHDRGDRQRVLTNLAESVVAAIVSTSLNDGDLAKLPATRGIYQITNGRVSYVGLSDNIRRRIREHLESRSCRSRIVLDTGRARCIVLELLPRASDRALAEREWYWFDRLQKQNQVLVNDPNSLGRTPSGRYGPPAGMANPLRDRRSSKFAGAGGTDRDGPTKPLAERQFASPWEWLMIAIVGCLSFSGGYLAVQQWLRWEVEQSGPDETFAAPFLDDCVDSLQRGDRGEAVRNLQERLQRLGFYDGTIDGAFGPNTQAAVSAFQRQHALTDDAIAGCQTQRAIQTAIDTGSGSGR